MSRNDTLYIMLSKNIRKKCKQVKEEHPRKKVFRDRKTVAHKQNDNKLTGQKTYSSTKCMKSKKENA